jgi:hypothetical protein
LYFVFRAKEILRLTAKKDQGGAFDKLKAHVNGCDAAELVRTKSGKLRHEQWKLNYFVLQEDCEGLTPTDAQLWLATAKYCVELLEHDDADPLKLVETYVDSSGPYTDDDEEMQAWDPETPVLRFLPLCDEDDAQDLASVVKVVYFNDSVLLMVKDSETVDKLAPLLTLSYAIVDKYQECNVGQWRASANEVVVHAWDCVLNACLGLICMISPVPLDRGSNMDHVMWVFPDKERKRKTIKGPAAQSEAEDEGAKNTDSIAAINDVGASMFQHMRQDPVWLGLRGAASTHASVDAAWSKKMKTQIESLDQMGDDEQGDVLAKSMKMFSEGTSTLRPDGAKPLQKVLQRIVATKVDKLVSSSDEDRTERMMSLRLVCSELGMEKSDQLLFETLATEHQSDIQSTLKSACGSEADLASTGTCKALVAALQTARSDENVIGPFMAQLQLVREKVIEGVAQLAASSVASDMAISPKWGSEHKALLEELADILSGSRSLHSTPVAGGLVWDVCKSAAKFKASLIDVQKDLSGNVRDMAQSTLLKDADAYSAMLVKLNKVREQATVAHANVVRQAVVESFWKPACQAIKDHSKEILQSLLDEIAKKETAFSPKASGSPNATLKPGVNWYDGVPKAQRKTLSAVVAEANKVLPSIDGDAINAERYALNEDVLQPNMHQRFSDSKSCCLFIRSMHFMLQSFHVPLLSMLQDVKAFQEKWAETLPYFNEELQGQKDILEKTTKTTERASLLQFEAEVWNATKYKGKDKTDLLKSANDNVTGNADPSDSVQAFWELVQKEIKK